MSYVLVFDCGATNVRAGAVDERGRILHLESMPNAAIRERADRDWLIWDTEAIWEKLLACAKRTVSAVGRAGCAAIVVTSFSDDGAPVDADGRLLYPVISWQCPRTNGMVSDIEKRISLDALYTITGEQILPQHTLFRILWLREHAPVAMKKASRYVMFPHILDFRLTGRMVNDPTTADSMFLLDIARRTYSLDLLDRFGIDPKFFPEMVEPGQVVGMLLGSVTQAIGLAQPAPVVAGGHDTQYAVLGSGCGIGEAVLSSGTWEILFTRTQQCHASKTERHLGLKNECDAEQGVYNSGLQWIGCGALEWLGELLYPHIPDRQERYAAAQADAARVPAGSKGVHIIADLVPGTLGSMNGSSCAGGSINGCFLTTTRGELYRAMIESLCQNLRIGMQRLEDATAKRFERLIVVGGGARNSLWNQIRADTLGVPIQLTSQVENTLIGAMMVGCIGAGVYGSIEEARGNIDFFGKTIDPGSDRAHEG